MCVCVLLCWRGTQGLDWVWPSGGISGSGPGRLELEGSGPAESFMGFGPGRLELQGLGFGVYCFC